MGTSGSALNVPPSAPIPFALPLSSRNCILWTSQVHHMVPRNGTTSLSPHSPHPDQPAPGLSRTPSFLEFAPKRTSSHSQTMRSASVRPATSSGVTEARGLSSCRIRGIVSGRGGLGAGGLAFAIRSLGCQFDPADDHNQQGAEVSVPGICTQRNRTVQRGSAIG
ncbi:hypothetical protein AcV7_010151 [Taiwanofungus camphoratus]|nr:hypothetical protein AcV7_010148 [Antrodia cinnamomea]KAI0946081.1 hypothetical protein AcV7_010148 [Antrodia cinnamomea]KAI0946084.1 hypothetical protein AcV7_010151 [Antrodia cinnamomea]